MARRVFVTLLLGIAASPPAGAQTIVDTFHQFKATLGQLGAKRPPGPQVGSAHPDAGQAPAAAAQAGDDAMVPASALVADTSDSALERQPLTPRSVASFDVRGLRLGMSPREVARIAGRQGFRRRWTDSLATSGTFEAEATAIADRRLNRPVAKPRDVVLTIAQGADASGATLGCEWTLEPTGPKLSRIVYSARLDGSSPQDARAALIRKYGAPIGPEAALGALSWSNATKLLDHYSPSLVAVIDDNRLTLTLAQSPDYVTAARDRLEARAQQIAASRGSGVRF